MRPVEQGNILRVSGFMQPVIVVSNNFFNSSGKAVVCPIVQLADAGPLHLALDAEHTKGYILCEQVHYVDLSIRHFQVIDSSNYFSIMDFSDAVMGIFDYQL